jgi:hypothetical protein
MMKINWFSGVVQGIRCYWSNFVSSFSPRKFRPAKKGRVMIFSSENEPDSQNILATAFKQVVME